MRRIALVVSLALAALVPAVALGSVVREEGPAATAAAVSGSSFVFSGHGFGHGLGLSQWGARGYAAGGLTFDAILAHYYPGTQLAPTPATTVRVLLYDGVKSVTIRSDADFSVVDATGAAHTLPAGPVTIGPDLALPGEAQPLTGPLEFRPGTAPLGIRHHYRGTLRVSVVNGKLRIVNTVGLEDYLLGVVPAEMPSAWPAEALKAQAVAARTYALATAKPNVDFDLFNDQRSQVYSGIEAETPQTTAAVQATAGQTLLYGGRPILAMFFSSSGGQTASATETLPPSPPPPPYLVSVPDPYDAASPWHNWGPVVVPGTKIAKALKVPGALLDLQLQPGPSGRVETATAVGTQGKVSVTGAALRNALGLRSTWFQIGLLQLSRPAGDVTPGSQVALTGEVKGVADPVTLEQHASGTPWQPVGAVTPDANGTFSVSVTPSVTTCYRLTAGALSGGDIRVTVAPLVTLALADGNLSGTVQPAAAGTEVDLQQFVGAAWLTVATATVDATGAFTAPLPAGPGLYRARVAAAGGLTPGVSPVVQAGVSPVAQA